MSELHENTLFTFRITTVFFIATKSTTQMSLLKAVVHDILFVMAVQVPLRMSAWVVVMDISNLVAND